MITAHHPEWPGFKAKLEAEIESKRSELEIDQPESTTAALRGHIAALRGIIAMVEPKGVDAPQATFNTPR